MKALELRLVFGFAILLVITILALIIALGKVQQDTSYGLEIVLGSLATLAGAFAQWAFSKSNERTEKDDAGTDR